ncbi:hypothetical protein [Limnoglobus roseus]|uniref:Uncharacterized protein n=1 Tax=Limnoglobus roseus TaxID=2598579 RepID=A0A5C1AND8_9BACT|nr:hypothetical protein [Limnoglobus roseus]QEL19242.1 hypothetical protein PX52LOC_06304 [Limnoglobus roseus]
MVAKNVITELPDSTLTHWFELVETLREHFPEEVMAVDLTNKDEVTKTIKQLLNRLWRWQR